MAQKKAKSKFKFPQKVLEPVRKFLISELKHLTKRRERLRKDDPFANEERVNDNAAPDFEADEQFGHARLEAASKQLTKKMIQIRKALSRVKIGRYGICEKCGQFIDTKRLMIYPETTLCIQCVKKKAQKD